MYPLKSRIDQETTPFSTEPREISTAVLLLTAGASRRMRRTKALLPFSPRETFLEHLLTVYRTVGAQLVVVLPCAGSHAIVEVVRQSTFNPTLVWNSNPCGDRLSSILCGLEALSTDRYVFVQDVDRPFVTPSLLHALIASAHSTGYAVPAFDGKSGHPPLISPVVTHALRDLPHAATLRRALTHFDRRIVPVTSREHDVNINTPEEYERHVAHGHAY